MKKETKQRIVINKKMQHNLDNEEAETKKQEKKMKIKELEEDVRKMREQ